MLALTPIAADAVRALVTNMDIDDDTGGLRISAGEAHESSSLQLSVVDGPEASDQLVDAGGAYVFLEPLVTELLDDKLLDANVESGRVRFLLKDRGPGSDATA